MRMTNDSYSRLASTVLFILPAMLMLTSCEKKRQLQSEVEAVKQQVGESRKMMLALEEQVKAADRTAAERKNSAQNKDKMAAAEKQLKEITSALSNLQERIESAVQTNKRLADELAAYKRETAQP